MTFALKILAGGGSSASGNLGCRRCLKMCPSVWLYNIYNITKAKRASDWLIRHLLFAHGCKLLTYPLTKAKRALCDVAQFVVDSLGCAS